jgi:hypothetical protein
MILDLQKSPLYLIILIHKISSCIPSLNFHVLNLRNHIENSEAHTYKLRIYMIVADKAYRRIPVPL